MAACRMYCLLSIVVVTRTFYYNVCLFSIPEFAESQRSICFFLFAVGIILLLLKIFWNRLFNAMKQKPFVQFIQCLAMHLNALFYIILHRLYYTTYQTGSDPLPQYHIRIKCVRGTYNIFHWNNIRQFMCDFLTA